MKLMTKKKHNRKGFTLIELIVVLAILGILAAIAVPNFTAIQEDAKLKADTSTANNILKAVRLQHFSEGKSDGEHVNKLEKAYFDETGVTTQSRTNGEFKLFYFTNGASETEYGVYWITDTTTTKGYFVKESTNKMSDEVAIADTSSAKTIAGLDSDGNGTTDSGDTTFTSTLDIN